MLYQYGEIICHTDAAMQHTQYIVIHKPGGLLLVEKTDVYSISVFALF